MSVALITGVLGQDGRLLAEALLTRGWDVHGTSLAGSDTRHDSRIVLHEADLADPAAVRSVVDVADPDLVVNLAAISSVAQSWSDPVGTSAVNGHAVVVLLDACRALQDRRGRPVRVVQASTAEIFGDPLATPQDEETPARPMNPYGIAKAMAHASVQAFRRRGMFASNAILYNHESPLRPTTFVTRKITRAAASIALGLSDELRLGNLAARRDWSWAPDVVEAIRLIAQADQPDDYVVASGRAHSIEEFVVAAFAAAGVADWRAHVVLDEAFLRPADSAELVGDASRIRDRLGWSPTYGFEEIVAAMVAHDLEDLRIAGGDGQV